MLLCGGCSWNTRPVGTPGSRSGDADDDRGLVREVERLDLAAYAAVAATPTPTLDRAMAQLSSAADYSRVSFATAAGLAVLGGRRGRRAAAAGLVSVAVTSAVVNIGLKPIGRRPRPERLAEEVPTGRHIPMPMSSSFPSGHSAAAFAFAGGAGREMPAASIPLHGLAGLVAYSRVHTGVHYPLDALVGSIIGSALSQMSTAAFESLRSRGTSAG